MWIGVYKIDKFPLPANFLHMAHNPTQPSKSLLLFKIRLDPPAYPSCAHFPHVQKNDRFWQICSCIQFTDRLLLDWRDGQHFRLHLVNSIGVPHIIALTVAMEVESSWPRNQGPEGSSNPSNRPRVVAVSCGKFRNQAHRNTFSVALPLYKNHPYF